MERNERVAQKRIESTHHYVEHSARIRDSQLFAPGECKRDVLRERSRKRTPSHERLGDRLPNAIRVQLQRTPDLFDNFSCLKS